MSVRVSVILDRKGADVATIPPDATVIDALRALADHDVGALVVSAAGDTVDGIISERDIVRRLADEGEATLHAPVKAVMTADVRTCGPDETSDAVMEAMTRHRGRHLPVVVDGRLAGIVSIGDVVKARIDELTFEKESMQSYISGSPRM
ncbi:MAG TPA: CBS domain-containing protein [Euzebyales bacterium]